METIIIRNIPEWASCYIMYGDDAGLIDIDIETVREYLDGLHRDGYRLVSPIEGTHNDFCIHPEFGLACATDDWTAIEIERN